MGLTQKQSKFIDSYLAQGDKIQAAIYAGYSTKSAHPIACQLLKDPKIITRITELKAITAKRELKEGLIPAKEFTKEAFVACALEDYKQLDITEPNKPRFLQLAGQGAGILGAQGDSRPNQTLNLTQINVNAPQTQLEAWELARKLIGND